MNALQASSPRSRALLAIADALRVLADEGPATPLRLEQAPREREELLTLDEAAALLRVHRRSVERLVHGKPCRRRFGRRVLVERAGLLALARRG